MPSTIHVDGAPYEYDTEAEAGVNLSTGKQWWGTRVKWRPGHSGKWRNCVLVDIHPFSADVIAEALTIYIRKTMKGA